MKKRYLFAGLTGVLAGAVATKLLTRPRDVSWPDSLEFVYNPECSWFTRVDGVRIHFQEAGDEDATPIILIHGFISSNSIWSHVLLPLAHRGFRAIAPDLPGYGYSDKPADAKYSIAEQARAVIGLMDRLHIKKAIIVGASYGGAVAATMALLSRSRAQADHDWRGHQRRREEEILIARFMPAADWRYRDAALSRVALDSAEANAGDVPADAETDQ